MAASTIEKRRKIRALEAQRDKYLEVTKTARSKLATLRAELKHMRKGG